MVRWRLRPGTPGLRAAGVKSLMFCSTIIPTSGRETLARAVTSVLDQQLDADFEVIVVNDSGELLPEKGWQQDPRVRILATDRRERSVARNTGAAAAAGTYLHFLDDDDWLLPGGLQALLNLSREQPEAVLLYGHTQFVDRTGKRLMLLKNGLSGKRGLIVIMSGEMIPLQSALVKKEVFETVNGFHPWMTAAQNHDLERRLLLHGDLEETPHAISCVERGEHGSTTRVHRIRSFSRRAREIILDEPGVFDKLTRSAAGEDYWSGRVAYIYLTSAVYNLAKAQIIPAVRRLGPGLRALLHGRRSWFSAAFWRALFLPFRSEAFARASERTEKTG